MKNTVIGNVKLKYFEKIFVNTTEIMVEIIHTI